VTGCGNWQKYQSSNPIQRFLIRNFLRTVVTMTHSVPTSTILDAGCAEGFVSQRLFEESPDARVTGIDTDLDALARGQTLHPTTWFGSGDITSLPFQDASFDLVVCTEVLEHLQYPGMALSELKRVASRYCLISVPHEPFFRLSNLMRGKNVSRLGDDVDHYQHWGAIAFHRLVSNYFRPVASRYPFPWQVLLGEVP
jgi:SAM-dependent methyltransferase